MDHPNVEINSLISILKQPFDQARTKNDLNEIKKNIEKVQFFQDCCNSVNDWQDMGEYLQYEFRKEGEKVIHRFDDTDALYVIIDGTVDIIVDLKETPMWGKELADLAKDLELDKSNLIKKI